MFGLDLIAVGLILAFVIVGALLFVGAIVFKRVEAKMDEKTYQQQGRHRNVGDRIADALEKIACQLERIHDAGEVVARLTRIESSLGRIEKLEAKQMASIDQILTEVNELPDINTSLETLFTRLAELIRAGDPVKTQQALDMIVAQKARTKAAIVAHTPAEGQVPPDPNPPV